MWFSKKKKIGLCLSGGGLRAISHIGVLQAIEDLNIEIKEISGTSAGAIIAAFYAKGFSAKEMFKIAVENEFFSRKTFKLIGSGFFSTAVLYKLFDKYLKEDDFKSLNIPLHVAATNIHTGKIRYFSSGKLYDKLVASAAFPIVFPTVAIEGHQYCDGGLLNNLPIEPLLKNCNYTIASHANAVAPLDDDAKLSTRVFLERLFYLGIANHVYQKSEQCDVFINPPKLTQYSIFSKKNSEILFKKGYETAMEQLKPLKLS